MEGSSDLPETSLGLLKELGKFCSSDSAWGASRCRAPEPVCKPGAGRTTWAIPLNLCTHHRKVASRSHPPIPALQPIQLTAHCLSTHTQA